MPGDTTGCKDVICENGVCWNVDGTPTCHCSSGFSGDTCEISMYNVSIIKNFNLVLTKKIYITV